MTRALCFAFLLTAVTAATAQPPAPPDLPKPYDTPSAKHFAKVIGWPEGKTPTAPPGFTVSLFAKDLNAPRWLYVLPNGDVLVSEARTPPKKATTKDAKEQQEAQKQAKSVGKSGNNIILLRGNTKNGLHEVRVAFASDLVRPFGMALVGDTFFVGNTDAVVAYPYKGGQTRVENGRVVHALPAVVGYNNHWTRNVVPSPDGKKLYVTVGSGSNVGEHGMGYELLRANILEMNLDGTGLRVFASGIRNPVGLAWEPKTNALWTAVNERDELGDELVPDYLTSVKDGAFYGWPYSYFGQNEDPRRKGERPDLVAKAVVPDVPLGSHTASLGLAFGTSQAFPEKYRGGAFIGQHGSWNHSTFVGYRVAYVPFKDGKPSGPQEPFLTGFIANDKEVYGRPVGVAFAADGAMLVADDGADCIWRVAANEAGK